MLCIQKLSPFGYTPLLVSLKPSPLSPCVCVCVLKYLVFSKKKNSGLIPHWKMSVSYRGLKHMLCIQELGPFGYTLLLVSLKSSSFSSCVCVCVKIFSILKRKNSGLIPHWKMSMSYRGLKSVLVSNS